MSKMPAFQFYPGDWRKDANLSRASLAAKGAMIEIMCLAFECEKRGILKTGSTAWTIDEIATAIGGDFQINKNAIQELIDKKILKKDRKNAIFSSRMCKDEKIRKVRSAAGSKGGNPILLKQKAQQKPTPSASASSSASLSIAGQMNLSEIFQHLRTATDRNVTDDQLRYESREFEKKYKSANVKNLKSLCNSWAGNIKVWQKQDKSKDSYM